MASACFENTEKEMMSNVDDDSEFNCCTLETLCSSELKLKCQPGKCCDDCNRARRLLIGLKRLPIYLYPGWPRDAGGLYEELLGIDGEFVDYVHVYSIGITLQNFKNLEKLGFSEEEISHSLMQTDFSFTKALDLLLKD